MTCKIVIKLLWNCNKIIKFYILKILKLTLSIRKLKAIDSKIINQNHVLQLAGGLGLNELKMWNPWNFTMKLIP